MRRRVRILKARFRTREKFLEAIEVKAGKAEIFCRTTTPVEARERVLVAVAFPEIPNRVMLRGTALSWRPASPRLGVKAGARVAVDEDQRREIGFLLDVAEGRRKPGPRRHTRLPVDIPARIREAGSTRARATSLREISVSGAFLGPHPDLKEGADVVLEIMTPGAQVPTELAGRVLVSSGDGTSVEFYARDTGGIRRLRELLRRFQGAGGEPPPTQR